MNTRNPRRRWSVFTGGRTGDVHSPVRGPMDAAPHGYGLWRFTNRCNRIITVVTCLEGGSLATSVSNTYGRDPLSGSINTTTMYTFSNQARRIG